MRLDFAQALSEIERCLINSGLLEEPVTDLDSKGILKKENKTIRDEGITVDFWIIKVHTFN